MLLEIEPPYLDDVQVFWPTAQGNYAVHQTGDLLPFSERVAQHRTFLLPLNLHQAHTTGFIRIQTHSSTLAIVKAWTIADFNQYAPKSYFIFALLIGIAISLFACNIRKHHWLTDQVYRAYMVFLFFQILAMFMFNGFGTQFFLQNSPWLANQMVPFIALGLLISISFAYLRFLNLTWHKKPILFSATVFIIGLGFMGVVSIFFDHYVDVAPIIGAFVILAYVLWLGHGVMLYYQKVEESQWIILASVSGLFGSIATILVLMGHLSVDTIGLYAYQWGALGALIGFQLAMNGRIKRTLSKAIKLETTAIATKKALATERKTRTLQEQFLAMLNHELKTPLSVIRMAIDQPDALAKLKPLAITAIQDIEAILERCYFTDRMENTQLPVHLQNIDLTALTKALCIKTQAPQRFVWQTPDTPLFIKTDDILITVIIQNLLDNALKYSAKNSAILIGLTAQNNGVLFEVTNQLGAAGLPDEELLFDKYYRGQKTRVQSGSGLGLYLVKGLVSHIGGKVTHHTKNNQMTLQVFLSNHDLKAIKE